MVDFTRALQTAQRLIGENGRSVTFVAFDAGQQDPARPWLGPADPRATPARELTLDAVFVQPESGEELGRRSVSPDLVKKSDQIMIVSPGATETLAEFHEVVDDGQRWKIMGIELLRPATVGVLAFVGVAR